MDVLLDPERRWAARGLCIGTDPEIFFSAGNSQLNRAPSKAVQAQWEGAKAVCRMCPVQPQCERDTLGEEYGIWGGRDQYQRWRTRKKLPKVAATWPQEKRLAWGRRLAGMRQEEMTYREIFRLTGFSTLLVDGLIKEWEERPRPKPKVAEPAVSQPQHKSGFPEEIGQRDAWVRHETRVADAFYIAQTADGRWFQFKCFSGRGNVRKWFRPEDVLIYRPQVVVIKEYAARPDEPGPAIEVRAFPARTYTSTHCASGHAYTEANTHRKSTGFRVCRACGRERSRDNRRKEAERRAASGPHLVLIKGNAGAVRAAVLPVPHREGAPAPSAVACGG